MLAMHVVPAKVWFPLGALCETLIFMFVFHNLWMRSVSNSPVCLHYLTVHDGTKPVFIKQNKKDACVKLVSGVYILLAGTQALKLHQLWQLYSGEDGTRRTDKQWAEPHQNNRQGTRTKNWVCGWFVCVCVCVCACVCMCVYAWMGLNAHPPLPC